MNLTVSAVATCGRVLLLLAMCAYSAGCDRADVERRPAVAEPLLPDLTLPEHVRGTFAGDLSEIRERGIIRVLVSPNRTDFFIKAGEPQGVIPGALREFERHLAADRENTDLPVSIRYVLVPLDDLIPALVDGRGDFAASFLTITPERQARVDFVSGKMPIDELVIAHKDAPLPTTFADLAGRVIHVVRGSSYAEHLRARNVGLVSEGKKPVAIREPASHVSSEDLIELVNAGVIEMTVMDDFRARLWARVLPDIRIAEDVPVHEGGRLGWAIRKNNPELRDYLADFGRDNLQKGTLIGNILFKRYYGSTRWIANPLRESEQVKLIKLIDLFRKYGDKFGFDYLAIAAQAFQESRFDHSKKSNAGAIGVMQLLPSTARDPNVGIPDIDDVENNVRAGTKYLAFLRDRYFADEGLSDEDRLAFSWAAYNAGPASVSKMRHRAGEMGLDANRWFGNVEYAALDLIGTETVRYVGNVFKYYVAYRSMDRLRHATNSAIESM